MRQQAVMQCKCVCKLRAASGTRMDWPLLYWSRLHFITGTRMDWPLIYWSRLHFITGTRMDWPLIYWSRLHFIIVHGSGLFPFLQQISRQTS